MAHLTPVKKPQHHDNTEVTLLISQRCKYALIFNKLDLKAIDTWHVYFASEKLR